MTLAAGVLLGRYRIEALAGAGGMGEVYRARDTHLDRIVAIKVLPSAFATDPARRERFADEARAIARLTHPHICTLHEFDRAPGPSGGAPIDFLVLEYLEGRTLAAALAASQGLPLKDALALAVQVAEALAAAHQRGIVHRDLKPGNIMLTRGSGARPDAHVKLLDFGLARLRAPGPAPPGASTVTTPASDASAIAGTLPYMAPEQLEGRATDARTDLFAFGAVVYEMVTGRRAFAGDSQASVISAIMTAEPPPLSTSHPLTPPALDRVIRKCLAKDPELRWRDAQDLADELRWIAEDSGAVRAVPTPPVPPPWPWKLKAAGAVAAVGIGAAVWWFAATAPPLPPMRTIPLTSYPGEEREPALSPDGERVAFTWRGPSGTGPFKLYVLQVDGGTPLLVHEAAGNVFTPAWSPDGRQLAFIAHIQAPDDEPDDGVFLVPALGGAARHLETIRGHGLSWSPDGETIALSHRETATAPHAIHLFSIGTGTMTPLTQPTSEFMNGDLDPRFSPDGRTIAFQRAKLMHQSDLHVAPVSGDGARRLTFTPSHLLGFDWTADGNGLVYSAYLPGTQNVIGLWTVPMAGGPAEPLSVGGVGQSPSVSRDGRRLVYLQGSIRASIWRVGGPNASPADRMPRPLLTSTSFDYHPSYSPDASQIAFASMRSGHSEIWVASGEGEAPRQLTYLEQYSHGPRWSPDGRQIAFASTRDDNLDIYVVSAAGSIPRPLTTNPGNDLAPSWSGDGKWIYFASYRGGAPEIWRIAADGGTPSPVASGRGIAPTADPDGRYLYYAKRDESGVGPMGIWRRPLAGGMEEQVLPFGVLNMWNILESGICYLRDEDRARIEYFEFATGKVSPVAELDGLVRYLGMPISFDGRWILYTRQVDESDIVLVENFR